MKLLDGLSWRRGIAELAIVIFGILIALAGDDWYSGLQQRQQESGWVVGLRDDLLTDRDFLRGELVRLEESSLVLRGLLESVEDRSSPVLDTLAYLRQVNSALVTNYFSPASTTYNELIGSGGFSQLSDRELVRAVIAYRQASLFIADQNEYLRQVKIFDYNAALAQSLPSTILADMTEDWYIHNVGGWPGSTEDPSPLEMMGVIDLDRFRASEAFRIALSRSLDATVIQRGDLHRMLGECETALAIAEAAAARFAG